jgi:DNA-binding NtrC family response regulator
LALRSLRDERKAPAVERLGAVDDGMRPVVAHVERVAALPIAVLVRGERGTPKCALAAHLHEKSPRGARPLSRMRCRDVGGDRADGVLFGTLQTRGLLEQANGSTLVLEDIEALPLAVQEKLTQAITERVLRRGDGTFVRVDVRLISTTEVDLAQEAAQGRVSDDLLYRLASATIEVPALRDRVRDLTSMAARFVESMPETGRRMDAVSPEAMGALMAYPWPGNDRELELVLARASLLAPTGTVEVGDLPPEVRQREDTKPHKMPGSMAGANLLSFEEYEQRALRIALEQTGGNVTKAARKLGIGRATFYRKAKKFGLNLADDARGSEA